MSSPMPLRVSTMVSSKPFSSSVFFLGSTEYSITFLAGFLFFLGSGKVISRFFDTGNTKERNLSL